MPEPDVNVAVAQPQVQVMMPQPQVQVQPPAPQSQANVQVERQQPNVRVERTGEPQIVYRQAEGQPQIRFEAMGAAGGTTQTSSTPATQTAPAVSQQNAQAQLNGGQAGYATSSSSETVASAGAANPQTTGALAAASTMPIAVSRLEDMTLYNAREEKLGEVDAVVAGPNGRNYVVVSYGGFLGLGERRVAIPMESLALRQDRLVADTMTDEQLKALPDFERNAGYREMEDNQSAPMRVLR
jgi:hypothetical protein